MFSANRFIFFNMNVAIIKNHSIESTSKQRLSLKNCVMHRFEIEIVLNSLNNGTNRQLFATNLKIHFKNLK